MFTQLASNQRTFIAETIMSGCDYDTELRDAFDLTVPACFPSDSASIAGEDAPRGSDARTIADAARGHGGYRDQVFLRQQKLLTEITAQRGSPSLSEDERDYLSRLSSMIATLNFTSVASIDVLKICIVCSRFYPRIDIHRHLAVLKSEIEASLGIKAI